MCRLYVRKPLDVYVTCYRWFSLAITVRVSVQNVPRATTNEKISKRSAVFLLPSFYATRRRRRTWWFCARTSFTTIEKDCFFFYASIVFKSTDRLTFLKFFNGLAYWDYLDRTSHNSNKSITRMIGFKLLFNYVKISVRFLVKSWSITTIIGKT